MSSLDRFALLDWLTSSLPTQQVAVGGWHLEPVRGGHNNLLFRAVILVRWAGMFNRYIRQRDGGNRDNSRLSPMPEAWWKGLDGEYERYLRLAGQAFKDFLHPRHPR